MRALAGIVYELDVMWELMTVVFCRDPCESNVRDSSHG